MHGQQKKLNPIKDFAYPASKVPNTVSVKNPWHRWTSIGNVDRYQANEPAERLQNAWKTPEKRWRRSLVLFVFFFGLLRGRALWDGGGFGWSELSHPRARPLRQR